MKKRSMITIGILSACILLLCILLIVFQPQKQKTIVESVYETVTATETKQIYVYVEPKETTQQAEETSTCELCWTIRAYGEVIGVFDTENRLIQMIDVYTKTLPEADRNLLKEGIVIHSKKEYNALIEDYTA